MPVLTRKPAKPIPYPPTIPAPRTTHEYSTGESWAKVAQRFGFADPWAVIFYNFQCRNEREVNWCMQEYFGCTQSNDGKNYSFSTADRNRTIYIPPEGFVPFSADDIEARRQVIATLKQHTLGAINFQLGPNRVDQGLFGDVLKHIESNTILVLRMPDGYPADVQATYRPVENAMLIRDPRTVTIPRQAIIVHEAVHAGLDVRDAPGSKLDGEVCAYIAEAIFGLSPRTDLLTFDPMTQIPELHRRWAGVIAKRALLHGLNSLEPFRLSSIDPDVLVLKAHVAVLPRYHGQINQEMETDGV